jgi:hypothetical protein
LAAPPQAGAPGQLPPPAPPLIRDWYYPSWGLCCRWSASSFPTPNHPGRDRKRQSPETG